MSLHANLTPEAQASLAAQRRNSTIASVLVGVLLMALLSLLFWLIAVNVFSEKTEPMITFNEEIMDEEEVVQEKITTDVEKTPAAPSSSMSPVITAVTTTSFAVASPEVEVDSLTVDFGDSEGFGNGWGGGSGSGFGGGGGNMSTLFGRIGGGGLSGSFYDLKKDEDGKLTALGKFYKQNQGIPARLPVYANVMKGISRDKFAKREFRKYYKSDTELSFTNLVMDTNTSANEGPKAFQAKVEPAGWCVVYEGKIDPPTTGSKRVRFVGNFDDFVFVYINGKLALNGGCIAQNYFNLPEHAVNPGSRMRDSFAMRRGPWVEISKGTDIRIVVGESPGGHMGGGLFIEQQGETYRPDRQGGKILPPFTTEALRDEDKKRLNNISKYGGKGKFAVETEKVPVFRVR